MSTGGPQAAYRQPAPPREVVVGPFPIHVGPLVPAVMLTAIGVLFAGLAISAAFSLSSGGGAYLGLALTGALALSLFLTAAPHFTGARRRGRATRIRVTARSLEVIRASGRVKVVPRVPGEQARVARVPKGRGGPPTASIAYGDYQMETIVLELFTLNGVVELTPAVEELRDALAEVPRA